MHDEYIKQITMGSTMRTRKKEKFGDLQEKIKVKLKQTKATLSDLRYNAKQISPKEFFDYMTGETPSGDKITLSDVLGSEFLMIHEVVEVSELKKRGIGINKQTVMTSPMTIVYETHYVASEFEFQHALEKGNYDWLGLRITHAKSWMEDPNMPKHLIRNYEALIKKFESRL